MSVSTKVLGMARRPLAATATAWRRRAIWRAVVLLALSLASAAPVVGSVVGPAFVGNEVVDLTWGPAGEGIHLVYVKIFRDGGEIGQPPDPNVGFFRDQGVTNMPDASSVAGRRVYYRAVPQNGIIALQGSLTQRLVNEVKFGYNGALTRVVGSAPTVNGIDMSSIAINISGSVANSGIPGQGSSSGIAVAGGQIRGSSSFNGRGFPYTPYSGKWSETG
jgi:hypothetical protein